jgi:DNA-binding CsgD family transcriptional regulator
VPVDLDLIAMIYEAAVVPEQWPSVLSKIGSLVGSFGEAIVSIDTALATRFITTKNYAKAYSDYVASGVSYENVRPKRAIARRHFGFLPDVELCSIAELQADPIYLEVLLPNGIGWTIGAVIPAPSSDVTFFDLCRTPEAGPFGANEVKQLDALRPHLARSALLATRLGLEQARAAAETLSLIGLPGGLISESGRVLSANSQLEALSPRIMVGAFDKLGLAGAGPTELLRRALEGKQRAGGETIGSIPMPASSSGNDPALVVHLVPVRRAAHDIFAGAKFVVIVTLVTAPVAPLTELLNGLFDLTPAEAKVARALAVGATIRDVAIRHAVTPETIKSQLSSIMFKTGTHRQTDLVRLLLSASPFPKPSTQAGTSTS